MTLYSRVNQPLKELPGLEVTVDQVLYMPELVGPEQELYPFLYAITIRNNSPLAVTVRGRKWVVRQDNAETNVVEGDGVVGQFPHLEPGAEFSYNSKHFVKGNSEAEGAFFVEGPNGQRFCTRIPRFSLMLPDWA